MAGWGVEAVRGKFVGTDEAGAVFAPITTFFPLSATPSRHLPITRRFLWKRLGAEGGSNWGQPTAKHCDGGSYQYLSSSLLGSSETILFGTRHLFTPLILLDSPRHSRSKAPHSLLWLFVG